LVWNKQSQNLSRRDHGGREEGLGGFRSKTYLTTEPPRTRSIDWYCKDKIYLTETAEDAESTKKHGAPNIPSGSG